MEYLKGAGNTASMHIEAGRSFISAHTPTILSDNFSKVGSLASRFFSVCKNILKSTESYLKNKVSPFLEKKLSSGKDFIQNNPKLSGGIAIALVAITAVIIAVRCLRKESVQELHTKWADKREELRDEKAAQKRSGIIDQTKINALIDEVVALRRAFVAAKKTRQESPQDNRSPVELLALVRAKFSEYEEICEKNKTTDSTVQKTLLKERENLTSQLYNAVETQENPLQGHKSPTLTALELVSLLKNPPQKIPTEETYYVACTKLDSMLTHQLYRAIKREATSKGK